MALANSTLGELNGSVPTKASRPATTIAATTTPTTAPAIGRDTNHKKWPGDSGAPAISSVSDQLTAPSAPYSAANSNVRKLLDGSHQYVITIDMITPRS